VLLPKFRYGIECDTLNGYKPDLLPSTTFLNSPITEKAYLSGSTSDLCFDGARFQLIQVVRSFLQHSEMHVLVGAEYTEEAMLCHFYVIRFCLTTDFFSHSFSENLQRVEGTDA
jgi:hypothetical protein